MSGAQFVPKGIPTFCIQYHFQLQPSHFLSWSSECCSIFLLSCGLVISVSTYRPSCHMRLYLHHRQGITVTFKKGPTYRLPSRIKFSEFRSIVEESLQRNCKRQCKKEGVKMHALNDWKNEFLRIVDIRIVNFTVHPHWNKQPPSRSVKAIRRKMERLHSKCVFAPTDKAANNVIII